MAEGTAPGAPRKKLDVSGTVGNSITSVTGNFGAFLKIAALPGLLYILVGLAPFLPILLWQAGQLDLVAGIAPYIDIVPALISYAAGIYFAVGWHRFLLLGDAGGTPKVFLAWRRPHWRFLLYTLLLVVLPSVASMVVVFTILYPGLGRGLNLGWPASILVLAALAVAIWLWFRVSLVYPAAAVDARGYGLKQAWRDTKGNVLRLVLVTLLVFVPITAVLWIVVFLAAEIFLSPQGDPGAVVALSALVLGSVAFLALQVLFLALTVSIFSIAFRELASWPPPGETSEPGTAA